MFIWILLIIVPMLFGLYAQMKIRRAYARNVEIPSRGHIRGVEAAEAVMRSAGISDVEIVEVPGELTDHYDPMNKRLALSHHNYHGTSLAALGVAAQTAALGLSGYVGMLVIDYCNQVVDGDFNPNPACYPSVASLAAGVRRSSRPSRSAAATCTSSARTSRAAARSRSTGSTRASRRAC